MHGTDSFHDMCVMNINATSYQSKSPEKCLETAEKVNKRKYFNTCLKKRRHFITFVVSVEVFLGVREEETLKRIARRLATKWKEPYPQICG